MNYSSRVDEYDRGFPGIERKDCSELVGMLVSIKQACTRAFTPAKLACASLREKRSCSLAEAKIRPHFVKFEM